jgi:G:T/U-mismatch repair DNA glycosylase
MVTENHPYNNYDLIPDATRLLIIGTAPPPRFSNPRSTDLNPLHESDVDFYYGSKDNLLWTEILPELYPNALPLRGKTSADDRRAFLRNHSLWMHDICEQYTRDGSDASDEGLATLACSDLKRIFEAIPLIETLVFTGGVAERLSGKRMEDQGLLRPYRFGANGISSKPMPRLRLLTIELNGVERTIRTFTAPSPSPSTLRSYSFEHIVDQYRAILLDPRLDV